MIGLYLLPLDFNQLSSGSVVDRAVEPRRIFAALPSKDPKYNYPRDVQTEVWEQWHERRNDRDLVIRMNTGGGKTVVGLLILKSCLNERKGPAVYLTPDRYLAEQVRQEAELLGIEVTEDPRNGRFLGGKAILVTNIKTLVNGMSKFGLADGTTGIEIGSLLVDDAHAGVSHLQEQFTLRIPRDHTAFNALLALFDEELNNRSPNTLRDVVHKDWSAVLAVPFWSWVKRQGQVLDALHKHRNDADFKFVWPLIKDCLPICRVAITAREIEVAPPCPPIEQIPSLINAQRRIYLTATLADDSVLVTHFGADAVSVSKPITPATADDLGDRMILTPLDTHPNINANDVTDFLVEHARRRNVVVIVPSFKAARQWSRHAQLVLDASTIEDGVERLRREHVGLVVLINKYDGIDLPGNACRILAIEGLPEVYGGLDRLDALALGENEAISSRQIQRLEQGMGRGVRSTDDHCVVLLLGSRLTQRLHGARAFSRFSPATRAQLTLSQQVAQQLYAKPFSDFSEVVDQCLHRDKGWVNASRDVLDNVQYDKDRPIAALASSQRKAFDQAAVGQYQAAAETLQSAINELEDDRVKGWLYQQVAAYRHFNDPVGAQRTLVSALKLNRYILKPRDNVDYIRLKAHSHQSEACATFLSARYGSADELLVGFNAILEDLEPHPDSTEAFEQAWADLGQHLGFAVERPEKERGNGPDVLWALGNSKYMIVECKSGTTTATSIYRNDAEQLSHSVDWFLSRYDATFTPYPVLIHKVATMNGDAVLRSGARIVTFERLAGVRAGVREYARSVAADGAYKSAQAVGERLAAAAFNGAAFLDRYSIQAKPAIR